MLDLLRPPGAGGAAAEMGRAEAAARMAMVCEADDPPAPASRRPHALYTYFGAGLVVSGALMGAVLLLAPL